MGFWHGWQLWEKMCFILGTSIVLVIGAGFIKLAYNRYRIRKYTKIAALKAAHRTEMQRAPSTRRRPDPGVPFGVRALESGIEVDGVWISGTNTPTSMPGTPEPFGMNEKSRAVGRESPSSDRASSSASMSRLDLASPTQGHDPTRPIAQVPGRASYQPRRSSALRYESETGGTGDRGSGDRARSIASLQPSPLRIGADATRPTQSRATTSDNDMEDVEAQTHQGQKYDHHPAHDADTRLGGYPSRQLHYPAHSEHTGTASSDDGYGDFRGELRPAVSSRYLPSRDGSGQHLQQSHGRISPASEASDPFLTPTRGRTPNPVESYQKHHHAYSYEYDHELERQHEDEHVIYPGGLQYDQAHAQPHSRYQRSPSDSESGSEDARAHQHEQNFIAEPQPVASAHQYQQHYQSSTSTPQQHEYFPGPQHMGPGVTDQPLQNVDSRVSASADTAGSPNRNTQRESKKLQRKRGPK